MNMKNVKAITIPAGEVKEIRDPNLNFNIIWGSQAAFPYRRLEYVICNGSAACDSGMLASTASGNAVTKFITKIKTGSNVSTQQRVISNYTAGATYSRMYAVLVNESKIQNVIGSNWGNGPAMSPNTEYELESSMYCNDRYIIVNGVKTQFGAMNSYTATSGNTYGIGAGINKANSPIFETGFTGYIYDIEMVSQNGNRHFYFIPVQRKSDNKVGFLEFSVFNGVYNNDYKFLPSTWLSEFGAGPVVDEYWDLTVGQTWHTLWSGSCTAVSTGKSTQTIDGSPDIRKLLVSTVPGTGYTPKLRLTFSDLSLSNTSSSLHYWYKHYAVNGVTTSLGEKPTSPLVIDSVNPYIKCDLLYAQIEQYSSATDRLDGKNTVRIQSRQSTAANNLNILIYSRDNDGGSSLADGGSLNTAQLTITKIEQYY